MLDPNGEARDSPDKRDLAPIYNWTATTIPSGATTPTFSVNGTNSAGSPTVTFYKAGSYTFTVTITDPNSELSTTSPVTVLVNQTLTSLSLSPASVTVANGATQQFTANAIDQFGNAATSQTSFTWSLGAGGAGGTLSSSGLYTAPASGFGIDNISVTSGSFTATAAATVSLSSTTAPVNLAGVYNKVGIVVDGTTFTGGVDGVGNALSGKLLGTSETFNSSTFTIAANTSGNTTNNVISATGQTISLTPGRDSTIELLGLRTNGAAVETFTANYTDGSTQTISQGFSDWFTYTAYAGQTQALAMSYRDTSTGGQDARTFNLFGYILNVNNAKTISSITLPNDTQVSILSIDTVGVPTPTVTTPASATPSPVTGNSTGLRVSGADPAGHAAPIYTWAATSVPAGAPLPAITPNGTASANNATASFSLAGPYTFTVTISDPSTNLIITSSINVTVNQTLTQIKVTPAGPVSLLNGQTSQFSADAVDQFGQDMSPQPGVTWNVSSGIGSVNATGLYQSPSNGSGAAVVQATSGTVFGQSTVQVKLPAWLGAGSAAVWDSSTRILSVTGAASIIADPGSDQPIIMANSSAAVVTINPASALQIHLGGLSLTGGAMAKVTSLGTDRSATNHRLLVLGIAGATRAPVFVIDSSSRLDLTDNDLVAHAGDIAGVFRMVQSGFNAGGAYWNGSGIISSTSAAASLFALGVGPATAPGTFDGESVNTADVEIRFTYYGDANLNGSVTSPDYTLIDGAYLNNRGTGSALTGWSNGDFNYDNVVNGSDYTLIDNAFNTQTASLAAQIATPAVSRIQNSVLVVNTYPASSVEDTSDPRKQKSRHNIVRPADLMADTL